MVDRPQHQRYLTYLKKYEYFGRGRRKLSLDEFVALEAEAARATTVESTEQKTRDRLRDVTALLLRD
jgi:hypothetical protein